MCGQVENLNGYCEVEKSVKCAYLIFLMYKVYFLMKIQVFSGFLKCTKLITYNFFQIQRVIRYQRLHILPPHTRICNLKYILYVKSQKVIQKQILYICAIRFVLSLSILILHLHFMTFNQNSESKSVIFKTRKDLTIEFS